MPAGSAGPAAARGGLRAALGDLLKILDAALFSAN